MYQSKEELVLALKSYKKNANQTYVPASHEEFLESCLTSKPWVCGGMWGGNCWGGSANIEVKSEPENSIELLNSFLEDNLPSISFKVYRQLIAKEKVLEYSYREYYGNYTRYKIAYISMEDICDILWENMP